MLHNVTLIAQHDANKQATHLISYMIRWPLLVILCIVLHDVTLFWYRTTIAVPAVPEGGGLCSGALIDIPRFVQFERLCCVGICDPPFFRATKIWRADRQ